MGAAKPIAWHEGGGGDKSVGWCGAVRGAVRWLEGLGGVVGRYQLREVWAVVLTAG